MAKLGFEFRETMTGSYTLAGQPGVERPLRFQLRVHAEDAVAYARDHLAQASGTLEMDGFADEVAVAGTMLLTPLVKRVIRYELGFVANDGLPYKLAGQKDIRLSDLVGSLTTLPVQILDASGKAVARAQVKFDVRGDLLKFLASWKPLLPRFSAA
jgi:hypothetical protein